MSNQDNFIDDIHINETELFDLMINKINSTKTILEEIRSYTQNIDSNKKSAYLKKLLLVSTNIHTLYGETKDLFDEYIMQMQSNDLKESDRIQQKNLLINKNIQKLFLPYMLYLQVILQNST